MKGGGGFEIENTQSEINILNSTIRELINHRQVIIQNLQFKAFLNYYISFLICLFRPLALVAV